MGGSRTISNSETKIEALRLQSSSYGVTIPLVYGVSRVSGNMLWTGGFRAIATTTTQRAGKGGSVKTKNTTYSYTTHVAMGLSEGPIIGVPRIWRGKKQYSGGILASQILTTTHSYTVPGTGGSVTVTNSAAWTNTVVVYYTATLDLGNGATTGPVFLAEGVDYTVANGVYTFPAALGGRALTIQYQYLAAGTSEAGLAGLGMTKFSGQVGQATWSLLSGSFSSQAIPYSGIAYVAAQDYDLGGDASVENHNFEVQGPLAYHLGSSVTDVDPALFAFHLLTHQRYGALFPASRINFGLWSNYCRAAGLLLSPAMTEQTSAIEALAALGRLTNTAPVWSGGRLRMMPYGDASLTGNGATYSPNVTPVYDLDETCFRPRSGGEPVEQMPRPKADTHNHVRIEYLDRSNDYNIAIAEAKDQADIDSTGLRSAEVLKAHWITDATVARNVAQLLLQRSLYVAADYRFSLPPTFALLEPMDLVRLTSTGPLGLTDLVVRIKSVEEGEDGDLDIIAEEYSSGIATAAAYTPQASAGTNQNYNAAPGSVLAPTFFEAPAERTVTGLEVYAAVVGTGANWGGATVWVSLDGTNYSAAGVVFGGSRYGRLTGAISSGNLPVAINAGQLLAASANDAAALASLCYIGGSSPEYLAYEGATLTGSLAYTLSGLVRGQFGTSGTASHATNDPFVRVDEQVGKSGPLDQSLIGKTVYFKFTSFNIFQSAEQDLADVTAYSYTIAGTFALAAPPAPTGLSVGSYERQISFTITPAATAAQDTQYEILEHTSATPYSSAVVVWTGYSLTPSIPKTDATTRWYWVRARRNGVASPPYPAAGASGVSGAATLTANPVLASLTRPALTVLSYSDGTTFPPGAFDNANGSFVLTRDDVDLIPSATLSLVSNTNCTVQFNTAANTPVSGQPKGYYRVTALTADNGSAVLRATYGAVNYDLTLTVSRVRQGFEIVGALPTTNLFEGRIVFLTTDDKLYRYTGTAWTTAVPSTDITGQLTNSQIADLAATKLTGQITTTQITDEAISTPKLASGSVIAGKLAAGSVITSKLLVVPVSLCPDPYFDDTAWWTATVYDANGWFFENGGDLGTKRRATLWSGASTPPGTNRKHVWSDYIAPPAPGTSIRLRARAINDSNQDCYITVRFSTAAETDIGDVTLLIPKTIGYSATNLTIIGTVPANAARMRFIIYNEAGTTFTGIVFIGGIMLDVAASADLIVDGAVVADKLAANSVTSNKILAGSITAAKISVGAQSENLILNPGAEGNSTEAWAVVEQASGTGTVAASTAQRYSGDYSFRLASNGQYAAGHRAIPVVPGDVYTFRVRVKGSSSAANGLYLRMNEGASAPAKGFYGTDIDTANLRASLTDFVSNVAVPSAWTTYSFKYTVPSGVYWVTPSVYNWSSGVDVFFDDVEFRRTMDASYIANLDADVISAGTIKASKIELNGISTDRIALTAASASAAVSTSGTYNHTGWTTRGSVSYTPNDTDSRLAIYFGAVITQGDAAVGTCTTEARLLRAGTVIWGPTPVCRVKAIPTPFSSFVTQTSLSGASTYELQFQANVSSGSGDPHSVEQARILVVEFKR